MSANSSEETVLTAGASREANGNRLESRNVIAGASAKESLAIALLSYRGNPFCGGQGVYARQLSSALNDLGHRVTVVTGPPYPSLDEGVDEVRLPSLDLYRPGDPFRPDREIQNWIDAAEFGIMCTAGYPEPLTFSLRAWRYLRGHSGDFDVVHDNQCLGYGLLLAARSFPVVATVHHPISVDRRLELAQAPWKRRMGLRRWYHFVGMQGRVARRLSGIITVSQSARDEIKREMRVTGPRVAVIPNGVDHERFRPLPSVRRIRGRIVTTASADVPLKGLSHLLEAVAILRRSHCVELVVIGQPRPDGQVSRMLKRRELAASVKFVHGIDESALVAIYAEAEVAVVPSLYEGFSLPALEAMACGVPVVATSAGALPEVVGQDGETGLIVPPADPTALAGAIRRLLDDPGLRSRIGACGRLRAERLFSWKDAARKTAAEYRRVLAGC